MKRIFLLIAIVITTQVYSQEEENLFVTSGHVLLRLTVKTTNGEAAHLIDITANEKGSPLILKTTTDKNGKAELMLKRGKTYSLNFPEKPSLYSITAPAGGPNFFVKTLEYNPPTDYYKKEEIVTNGKTDTVRINKLPEQVADNESKAFLKVYDQKDKPLKNIEIRLFCKKLNRVFIAKTNLQGTASFVLPVSSRFSVSIEELENFKEFSTLDVAGANFSATYYYEPSEVTERISNDTIYQRVLSSAKASSSRVLVKAKIMDLNNVVLRDEPIYLVGEDGKETYTASTDELGFVRLLVPKGKKYNLHFKYERNVDLLDYTELKGFRETDIEYNYIGSSVIENFYQKAKRDKTGFINEFMEVKTQSVTFDRSKVKRREDGFDINFGDIKHTPSPAVYEGRIFLTEGFYSRNLYSFDAETGTFYWGRELAEKGASSVVISEGIVLVNTESCTLYAFDSKSGKMLWSKWLGSILYSSPAVANGKVFACYPNELSAGPENYKGDYVLISFELKTGKIIWQNWIDKEVLATPVIAEGGVYATTLSGKVYGFSEIDGKPLGKIDAQCLTPPTVQSGKLYILQQLNESINKKHIAVYNSKDLTFNTAFNTKVIVDGNDIPSEPVEKMNFNGGRPAIAENKIISSLGDKIYCFDKSGVVQWTFETGFKTDTPELMPAITAKKLVAADGKGNISIIDLLSGKEVKNIPTGGKPWTEPVVYGGWIYCGLENGKLFSYNTKDKTLTGWSMWGGDASHNPIR